MKWFTRHPDERVLNRFADGELGEHEHARVASHLAGCPRCREEVALTRRLGDVARTLPTPIATDEVLRRALARRAAGERVLLPMSDAGAPTRRRTRRFAPAAVAAMLTLMVASLVVSVRVLEADRPALRIHPARPVAGEPLRMEYHGGGLFADETHLALRARYRTAGDAYWQLLAGVLVRGEDGRFRTEVSLPDSVVYAAFAVEDLHGQRLDSNNRQLWDVMVHGEDGNPTLDAMTARLRDLERRDWGEAYEVAREMTERYPDAPQSWAIRLSFEVSLFDRDSVLADYRERYVELEKSVATAPFPIAGQIAWLGILATELGDYRSAEMWAREAVAAAPDETIAAEAEALAVTFNYRDELPYILRVLERGWGRVGGGSFMIANVGWHAALEAQDAEAALRWLKRYFALRPVEDLGLLPRGYALGEGEAGDELRAWIADHALRYAASTERPLIVPQERFERRQAEGMQRFMADLADAVRKSGDSGKAAQLAGQAVDLAWESRALLTIHEILEGSGIESGSALSKVAADPMTAELARARAQRLPPSERENWDSRVEEARRGLREYVLEAAIVSHVDSRIRVVGPERPMSFEELRGPNGTVVAFISRYCAPALAELPQMLELAAEMHERGVRFLLVSTDSDRELQRHLRGLGSDLDVYVDRYGEARNAFASSAAPDYFVLDSEGRIRFEHSEADEILRQLDALQGREATRVVALAP